MLDKAKLGSVVAVAVTDAFLYRFVQQDIGDVELAPVRSRDLQTVHRTHTNFFLLWLGIRACLGRIDNKVWLRRSHRGHLGFHVYKRCWLYDCLRNHLALWRLYHGLWAGLRRAVEQILMWCLLHLRCHHGHCWHHRFDFFRHIYYIQKEILIKFLI